MKILVIGGGGMLGHKLVDCWREKFDVWTTIRGKFEDYEQYKFFDEQKTCSNVNVENIEAVEKIIRAIKPDVIINAVGIIKQLETSKDVIKTLTVNSIFPHQLATLAKRYGSQLITLSTDCVFSGIKGNYTEDDIADAHDLYGKSKNLGEVATENCLTLRTSIIGRELKTSHSLVEWFLSQTGKKVKGYKYAVFSGFPTIVLADIMANLIVNHKKMSGLYHVSSQPICKFDLLVLLKKAYKIEIEIEPFEDFKIDRSFDSTKFKRETGFQPTSWEEMIERMANDPFPYHKLRK